MQHAGRTARRHQKVICHTGKVIQMLLLKWKICYKINYLENKYKKLYEGINNVEIIGTIISEKKELEYKEKYTIKVEKINGDKKYKNTKLIIYTKSNKKI